MNTIVTLILSIVLPLQAAGSVEDMYKDYITPEQQEMLDKFDQLEQDIQAAEQKDAKNKTWILLVSLAVGLIPVCVTGYRVLKQKTWKDNPSGTVRAMAVSLAGGAVIFAINYGILMLKYRLGDAFNTGLAFILVIAIIAVAIWLVTKTDKK